MARKFRIKVVSRRKNMTLECGGFVFTGDFDSGNILKVELVCKRETRLTKAATYSEDPDIEFNVWIKPDCYGTPFENSNKTWFYFGIRGEVPHALVKLNIVDVNRQTKMYSQGMVPVTRTVPGNKWERIRDRITYVSTETSFTLSFRFFTPENVKFTQYFAFTYPFTYMELQSNLLQLDHKHLATPGPANIDDIYYVRECVCKSLEGRRIDLITISSYHNITFEKEPRLNHLFSDEDSTRPFKFHDKKVIFMSARVHPGETPASFVFNGFLNLLLSRENQFAIALRRLYVFKLIPFLNPDGVVHGHYRTDTKGVNLNRLYLNPSMTEHPSVYAARALIRYHHYGYERPDDEYPHPENPSVESISSSDCSHESPEPHENPRCQVREDNLDAEESGLFLYIDLHGHASKKGIFMYGNHFSDQESNVECMLLPKLMSINNPNFHFFACNFTERNMYLKDKRDGLSREGSGRVAVLKLTGLIRSYTLECNYNTGRLVNALPPQVREGNGRPTMTSIVPPKFTPQIYEEVGKALGPSILDLTGDNPSSRLANSEFRTLTNMREWLKWYLVGGFSPSIEHTKSQMPSRTIAGSLLKNKPVRTASILSRNVKNERLSQKSSIGPRKPVHSKFTTPTISSNLKSKEVQKDSSGDFKYPPSTSAEVKQVPKKRVKPVTSELTKPIIRYKGNRRVVKLRCQTKLMGKDPEPSTSVIIEWNNPSPKHLGPKFKSDQTKVRATTTKTILKTTRAAVVKKPLRHRLATCTDGSFQMVKNKKRKKKKAKFI